LVSYILFSQKNLFGAVLGGSKYREDIFDGRVALHVVDSVANGAFELVDDDIPSDILTPLGGERLGAERR